MNQKSGVCDFCKENCRYDYDKWRWVGQKSNSEHCEKNPGPLDSEGKPKYPNNRFSHKVKEGKAA